VVFEYINSNHYGQAMDCQQGIIRFPLRNALQKNFMTLY